MLFGFFHPGLDAHFWYNQLWPKSQTTPNNHGCQESGTETILGIQVPKEGMSFFH
jgi:hypothetical protein